MGSSTRHQWTRLAVVCASLALLMLWSSQPIAAKVGPGALIHCGDAGFSTEEDFMSRGEEPPDGNPLISDGDLLSPDGSVCARNADLLVFFSRAAPLPDLGLDAVDVVDVEGYVVAFSTELDAPTGAFTAGDVVVTNGAVIPNLALVNPFRVTYDIGLDEVKLVGDLGKIRQFLDFAKGKSRESWLNPPDLLAQELKRFGIDLWFSTEGTALTPNNTIIFLDGDLLSAATGIVVVHQADLLPVTVPAGLPVRGVDFGLDAFAVPRNANVEIPGNVLFSTEIGYEPQEGPAPTFSDGDVLRKGNGVVRTNWDLIQNFKPDARDLGLDALFVAVDQPPPRDPNIQTLCGDFPAVDFDGGMALPGGPGTGLYRENSAAAPPGNPPRRPCGEYAPIDGFLPATGVDRFRVGYRAAGTPVPAPGTASGIRTNWTLYEWHGWPINACLPTGSLSTDANGWMDASDYVGAKNGTLTGCANSGLRLAVWDTNNHVGFGPPNKDGHYVVWLEWDDGAVLHSEAREHHVQLDNTLPAIAPFPNGLAVRLPDGTTPVPACGKAPPGSHIFQVWGQFKDDYYWNFSLTLRGGLPPAIVNYGPHNYYDLNDGTPLVKNTNATGTTPAATTVRLRDIDMNDLGASFKDCCYVLDLYVRDAAIRHTFNGRVANDNSGAYYSYAFITFAAAP